MSTDIDYAAVNLPTSKDFENWGHPERRAYLLQEIREVGHPGALNQSALARQFDVDPSTIHHDLDVLADAIADTPASRHDFYTECVFRTAVSELQAAGDHYKAAKVAKMWSEWLMDRGKVEKAAEKREVDISTVETETDTIRVVNADGEPLTGDGSGAW